MDSLSKVFFAALIVVFLWYAVKMTFAPADVDESSNDLDPVNFDDYDEDLEFEITINGTHVIFTQAASISVPADAEIMLRTKINPEDMQGNLNFEDIPKEHRAEWNYSVFEGNGLSDLDIIDDGEGCRVIHANDESKNTSVTIDCMMIDTKNDIRYMASCDINFEAVEVEEQSPVTEDTPLVQLEQK